MRQFDHSARTAAAGLSRRELLRWGGRWSAVLGAAALGWAPSPAALDGCGLQAAEAPAPHPIRTGTPEIVGWAGNGCGLLCRIAGKNLLFIEGDAEQMGRAHGELLGAQVRRLIERVVYFVGAADTVQSGRWFLEHMAEVERRTLPHIPSRFLVECDAMAEAARISRRDARYGNLFPERFHCSGVSVRGKATKDGQVLHARVLDYMRDISLQTCAALMVFRPKGRHAWISHGYAGFIGTVTAMNEKGLAIGEMGGRGEGKWDGLPMSFLLRDAAERAASVAEALDIMRAAPRTCEYYYVLSDRSGEIAAIHAEPDRFDVLRAGENHPQLPPALADTVLVSGPDRAVHLSERIKQHYGRIDAAAMIEIIKRPVAMESNLHNAVFAPQTLDLWIADAGKHTPACDEPYVHCNLRQLLDFFGEAKKKRPA